MIAAPPLVAGLSQSVPQRILRLMRAFEQATLEATGKRRYLGNHKNPENSRWFHVFKKLADLTLGFAAYEFIWWAVCYVNRCIDRPNLLLNSNVQESYRKHLHRSKAGLLKAGTENWLAQTHLDKVRAGLFLDMELLERYALVYPNYTDRLKACAGSLSTYFLATDSEFVRLANENYSFPAETLARVRTAISELLQNPNYFQIVKAERDTAIRMATNQLSA